MTDSPEPRKDLTVDNPFASSPTMERPAATLPTPPGALLVEDTPEQAPDAHTPVAQAPDTQEETAAAKKPRGSISGVAYDGKPATSPPRAAEVLVRSSRMREWLDNYEPLQLSPDDLDRVNKEIFTVSRAMTELEKIYSEVADMQLAAETTYSRARNRAALATSGGTAAVRDAYADVMVEDLQLHAAELKVELTRVERAVRMTAKHLDALMGIGHNLRATLKV